MPTFIFCERNHSSGCRVGGFWQSQNPDEIRRLVRNPVLAFHLRTTSGHGKACFYYILLLSIHFRALWCNSVAFIKPNFFFTRTR